MMFEGMFKKVTKNEIHFQIKFNPIAKVKLIKISLYKGKMLIKELENLNDKKFTNLEENTKYKIKIDYLYNQKEEHLFLETITLASPIVIAKIDFLDDNYYLENDSDILIKLSNPANLNIKSIYINDQKAKILSKKNNAYYKVNLELNNFSAKTDFKVTKIEYETHKVLLSQMIESKEFETKYILGDINAKSIKEENRVHYVLRDKDVTFKLMLDNKSKYKIKGVSLRINNEVNTFNENEIKIIDDENIEITYYASKSWSSYLTVSVFEILYDNFKGKTVNKKIKFVYTSLYRVKSNEVKQISNIEQLQNLENGFIYSLANDIDGKGFNWEPYEFVGVILGNGYSVKNILINHTEDNLVNEIGLFSEFKGVIERTIFKNFEFKINTDKNVFVGGVSGRSFRPVIMKNILISNFSFNIQKANEVTLGSLVGYEDKYGNFENIVMENVKIIINNVNDVRVGGLLGFSDSYNVLKETFINKLVINIESGSEVYFGALMGYSYRNDIHRTIVTNSYLNVDTTTGLFAYSNSFVGAGFQTVFHNIYLSDDVTVTMNKNKIVCDDDKIVLYNNLDLKDFYLSKLIFKEEDWHLANLNYLNNKFPKLKAFIK